MFTSRALTGLLTAALLSFTLSAQEVERGDVQLLLGDNVNPLCFQGPPPTMNSMWRGIVDGTEIAGSQGAMVMLSGGLWMGGGALNTEFGQILIDPSMAVYQLNRPFFTGRVMFGIPVPNDPSLIGQKYYSQALVYGYRVMQMCNGLELTLGSRLLPPEEGNE